MTALTIFANAVLIIAAVILFTRLHGLRAFSKMSSFDFAITVAFGSVIASAVTSPQDNAWIAVGALAALFVLQKALSLSRLHWPPVARLLDNRPRLVMRGDTIDDEALRAAGMTRSDLMAKLREANAWQRGRVIAVVAETTGDVSVLHGAEAGADDMAPGILDDVEGALQPSRPDDASATGLGGGAL